MVVGPHFISIDSLRYDFSSAASSGTFTFTLTMTEGRTTSTAFGEGDASQLTTIPASGDYIMKIESNYCAVQDSSGGNIFLFTDANTSDNVPQGNILIIAEDYTDVSGTEVRSDIIGAFIDDLNSDRTVAREQEVVISIIA